MGTTRSPVVGSPGSSQSMSASTTSIAPQPLDGDAQCLRAQHDDLGRPEAGVVRDGGHHLVVAAAGLVGADRPDDRRDRLGVGQPTDVDSRRIGVLPEAPRSPSAVRLASRDGTRHGGGVNDAGEDRADHEGSRGLPVVARHRRLCDTVAIRAVTPAVPSFTCASALDGVLLGYYDGRESWTVRVGAERSRDEQLLVSVHERLHHVLQSTTLWGLLVTATLSRALDGTMPPVADRAASGCRLTHEAFATYFSIADDPDDRALLAGNVEYEEHYERAAALAPPIANMEWPERSRIVDALLRAAMAPMGLLAIAPRRLATLRTRDLADDLLPDERLDHIADLAAEGGTSELARALPEADGIDGLVRFQDAVAGWLTARGVPAATWAQQRAWMAAVVDELNRTRADGAPQFDAVDQQGDPVREAVDDHQRERLGLNDDPLPLELIDPRDLQTRGRDFARGHADIGPHLLVVWLRADLLRRQFAVPEQLRDFHGHVFGLLSCDRTHGDPRAMLCPLPSAPSDALPALQARTPVLFLTTLASIIDTPSDVSFAGAPQVFALIDQPVLGFVDHTVDTGATLRWEPVWIDGDHQLSVFVFTNDTLPGVLFLHIASSASRQTLARWLRTLPADQVIHDPMLGEGSAHAGSLHAVLQHIMGTFREINQFGGRAGG